jgi:DNA 3'-phosphatase
MWISNKLDCLEWYVPEGLNLNFGTNPIAFFDIDSTLITRPNGKSAVYAETDSDNWIWLGPVPLVLNVYKQRGWSICFYTNQSKYNDIIKQKINNLINSINQLYGWEPWVFVATACAGSHSQRERHTASSKAPNKFRKPNPGILELIQFQPNSKSFMCGDGVGPSDLYAPYTWSDVDFQFAQNLGVKFIRPIDIFGSNLNFCNPKLKFQACILVGTPGSGKTSWAKSHSKFPSSFDELKSEKAMCGMAGKALLNSELIIFDATNGTKEKRAKWINWIKTLNPPINYCIVWFVREGRPWNSLRQKPVPEIAYNVYSKNFERPDESECPVLEIY